MLKIKYFSKLLIINLICLITLIYLVEKIPLRRLKYKSIVGRNRLINLREHNPNSIKYFIKSKKDYENNSDQNNKRFRIKTDKDGFILSNSQLKKSDIKIIFLGGSTTESTLVNEELRFPSLVSSKLNERLDNLKISSLNSGVSGNNSFHSFNSLVNKGLKYNPKFIVVMHNINDLNSLINMGNYWSNNSYAVRENKALVQFEISLKDKLIKTIKKFIKESFTTLFNSFNTFNTKRIEKNDAQSSSTKKLEINSINIEEINSQFENSLNSIISVSKAWGAEPILMTQMNRLKDDPDKEILFELKNDLERYNLDYKKYASFYSNFNQIIRKIASQNNITLIDLDKAIPKNSKYMYSIIHLTEVGSILAADIIVDKLYPLLK